MATQAVIGASKEASEIVNAAYAAQGRNRGKGQMQCYSCKENSAITKSRMDILSRTVLHIQKTDEPKLFKLLFHTLTLLFVDSGASNHMTGSPDSLHNLQQYTGTQNIQIANGNKLPITAIGDIGPSFRHVFVSPGLSTSLIFIGQMVDNNCDVQFSCGSCLV
ncbi:unnamed protein product [Musa banksii]